jgi:hypothetical protein
VPGRPGSFPLCWGRHARRRSTPAVRSRSLCCRVPSSKEEPRESIPRSVLRSVPAIPATVPDRPSSFSLCLRRARPPFAGRSAFGLGRCVAVFHSQGSREEPPANQFRGQCPLPYPIVPVLSGCVGAGTPAVRSWSLCWHVPFLRVLKGGAPRKSISRSVSATANTRVQETRDFERGSEGQFLRAILEVRWPYLGFLSPDSELKTAAA